MKDSRKQWIEILEKLARPVLEAGASQTLDIKMPIECQPGKEEYAKWRSPLEAVGRLLSGISPWLELESELDSMEERLQREFRELSRAALVSLFDKNSEDYIDLTWNRDGLVDVAKIALALLRSPNQLWLGLKDSERELVVDGMKQLRMHHVPRNNWLLFAATIEAFLMKYDLGGEPFRIDAGIHAFQKYYKGDGIYGDGKDFHWDYYNSFVIHPMLIDLLRAVKDQYDNWKEFYPKEIKRAQRYAEILERLISPEGTFPPIGRSLCYRFGMFHALSQMCLLEMLPETLNYGQVRAGITTVMQRMINSPGTFDEQSWLKIGFCGQQPSLGEGYISTGSLYLCSSALLPLGLSPEHEFWTSADEDWTSKKIWAGMDANAEHAYFE